MIKHSGWKVVLGTCILVLTVIAGTSSIAWGLPEPPPGGYTLRGPALLAQATYDGIQIVLSGAKCKGNLVGGSGIVVVQYSGSPVSAFPDANSLDGIIFSGAAQAFPECWDAVGGVTGDLIIQAVSGFSNNGTTLIADVVLLELLPK